MTDTSLQRLGAIEARALTERIRGAAEFLWALLAEAHDREAWVDLGYGSFKAYVETEFGMSRSRAYQLLDQARVMAALAEAAGVHHGGHLGISEREAREVKPHLALIESAVREATEDTEPELRPAAARAAVDQMRGHLRAQREAEAPSFLDEMEEPEPVKSGPAITKPDLGGGVSHPARFSSGLIELFVELVDLHLDDNDEDVPLILDPFAGTGRIHQMRDHILVDTVGMEIEPEWAGLHPDTVQGDATALDFPDAHFDAVVTSPTYGNRLADSYESVDPELRRSYRFDLGRPLTQGNSGSMHWGQEYRLLHEKAWSEAARVVRGGGLFILNIKDHVRDGARQYVAGWHITTLIRLGFSLLEHREVATPNLRQGANAEARLVEQVYVLRRDHA